MITITDVKFWLKLEGVDHILMRSSSGFNYTACGTMTNGGKIHQRKKRLCRKCKEQLGNLKRITE